MDKVKAKKARDARIIATNIFMGVMVIVIVFLLMFIAMGYTFNEEGELDQSGLVQIFSTPSGASVEIDNELQFSHTTINKMLSPGEHDFKITKSGYDNWYTTHNIESGLLTRIDWIRLFPIDPEISQAQDFDELDLISYSPSRKLLLVHEKDSKKLILANIQGDSIKTTEIKLSSIFGNNYKQADDEIIALTSWSLNDSRAILSLRSEDTTNWAIINFDQPDSSINLTSDFGLKFSNISFANDSGSKIWVVEDGKLHLINTSDKTISKTLARDIKKITNNRNTVAYIAPDENKHESLYIFHEEELGATKITTFENSESSHQLSTGTYWNEDWLLFTDDTKINILSGRYPVYDKDDNSTLKTILERDLEYSVTTASHGFNHRIVAVSNGENTMSFDFETKDYYDSKNDAKTNKINWLDNYIFWQYLQNKVIIRDFDGNNRREILTKLDNQLPISISENNKWLYFFEIIEEADKASTNAASAATDEEAEEDTEDSANSKETTIRYILKREKLTI